MQHWNQLAALALYLLAMHNPLNTNVFYMFYKCYYVIYYYIYGAACVQKYTTLQNLIEIVCGFQKLSQDKHPN